jgi:hypothetical protein
MQGLVHVTQKLRPGLPALRQRAEIEVIRSALRAGNERAGFRVVAFSALSNHLNLAIEVRSTAELSRGVQGLAIRLAKTLNKLWQRRGTVFLERFHARLADGIGAIRRVLVYVLNNAAQARPAAGSGRAGSVLVGTLVPLLECKRWQTEARAASGALAGGRDPGPRSGDGHLGLRGRRRRHACGSTTPPAAGRVLSAASPVVAEGASP